MEILGQSHGVIPDRRGITEGVTYGEWTLMTWQALCFPLDQACLASLHWHTGDRSGPAFHRGWFELARVGDTHLDPGAWCRGVVFDAGGTGRARREGLTRTLRDETR